MSSNNKYIYSSISSNDDKIIERDTNSMMYKIKDTIDIGIFYDSNKKVIFNDYEVLGSIIKE